MKILRKIKARSNKIFAYFSLFSMVANTLSPFAAMIPASAYAEDIGAPVEVIVEEKEPEEELGTITEEVDTGETADGQDSAVEEEKGNEITEEAIEEPVEEVVDPEAPDILEDGVTDYNPINDIEEVVEVEEIPTPVEEPVIIVEDSAPSELIEPEIPVVEKPIVVAKEYEYLVDGAEVIDSAKEDWKVDGEIAQTIEKVKLGVKYIFPLDEDVSVTFKKLPKLEEDRAYLKIERVRVDALELPADFVTNAEYAFDITIVDENGEPYSDDDEIMNNGEDFEYDLTLPKPEGVEAEIVYIEKSIEEASDKVKKVDIEEIIEVVEEDIEQESDEEKVKVKDLDHFTIFIVTSPSGPTLTTATVNNQSQVTVAPNENITVSLSVTRDGSENWGSTRYQIDSGSTVCVNHNNHNGNGTDSEQFIIQAPNSIGTHNLTLWASTNDSCGGTLSTSYPMTNAIVVQALTVVANPSLSQSCGLDIALVLDVSGSIDSGELTQMKNAFKAFVDALAGTPTQFSVTQFSTTATILQGFTSDLNAVKSAINNASNSGGSSLYTNWEDGLIKSRSTFDPRTSKPNMMIFSSDGNPNRIGITGTTATESVAVSTAQIISNAIKSEGTRILGIGIGSDLDSANMQKLTGNNVNTGDVLTSDLITTNFAGLATQLANFAKQTCGGTITINKYIDSIQPGNLATSSWTFNTNITGHQSVQTTDGSVNISVPVGTGYSINEPSTLSGYTFANASCQKSTGGSVGTPSGNGVTGITMGADDIIYCNFLNTTNKGTMILEKEMVGGVSSFTFTGNPSGTISTNGGKITVNNVTPGTYTTTESAKTGWDLTSIVCDDGTSTTPSTVDLTSRSATFKVDPGETVTCKFTNTIQTGHIIVDKVTSPSGDPQSFSFIANGTGYNNFSLTDSTTPNNQTLNVGTYSVSEDTVVGWDQTSAVCTSSIQDTETPASLELDPGETITCTFTNSKLNINVIKTANPTSLPETGGNVEFTVKVENPSAVSVELTSLIDDKFGNLNTSGTCSVPQTISAGEYYECKFTENLAGNAGGSHTNIVTATASGVIDTDDATVSFNDVLPTIEVTKTASPLAVPETGGDVTFTFTVKNTSTEEPVTITSLSDTVYGTLAGDADCAVGTVLAANATCEFSFTKWVEGDYQGSDHYNKFTAHVEDNDKTDAWDDDDATVDFSNVLPTIEVTKTAGTLVLPVPGGDIEFTVAVKNNSEEPVILTSLTDDIYGNLNGKGSCLTGVTIDPDGGTYTCSFTGSVTGNPGLYTDIVTVVATDNEGTTDTKSDDATVELEGGRIIIEKQTVPDADKQTFPFVPSWGRGFSLVDGNTSISMWLAPGYHTIREDAPNTWDVGINCSDSNSGLVEFNTAGVYLEADETVTCVFTNTRHEGSILINKIIDADGNLQTTEDQTAGADWLFTVGGGYADISPSTSSPTGVNGSALFSGLRTGHYDIHESTLLGYDLIGATCGSENGNLDGNTMYYVNVEKDTQTVCTFYNTPNGTIHGYKWSDYDGDGELDNQEELLSGWTINLYKSNGDGIFEQVNSMVTSSGQEHFGWYWFENLLPGDYKVCEAVQPNWLQTFPINDDDNCHLISLPSGNSNGFSLPSMVNAVDGPVYSFGNQEFSTVTVYKFHDLNANGTREENEPYLSDWEIDISKLETESNSKITDGDGKAVFSLLPDSYILSETVQEGWEQTGIYCKDIKEGVLITSSGEAYGHHGNCEGWNGCGDAKTCAQWACEINGYDRLVSYGDDRPCTQFGMCHLFYNKGSIQWNWGNWCDVRGVTDIYCSNGNGIVRQVADLVLEGNDYHDNVYNLRLNSGDNKTCYIGNVENSELRVSETNDSWPNTLGIGDTFTYTIEVRAVNGPVKNVIMTNLPPKGIEPQPGTFNAVSSERGSLGSTGVAYASPGDWDLGTMKKNEIVTITYEAKVTEDVDPGIYPDVSFAQGKSMGGSDLLALSEGSGFDINNGIVDENFVGTQVKIAVDAELNTDVDVKEEEKGKVLGASTELPATGADTFWLNILLVVASVGGLLLLIGGLGSMSTKKQKAIKKGKKAILGTLTLGLMTLFSYKVFAADPVVRLSQPQSPANSEFDLVFVAMDVEDRKMSAQCWIQKPGSSFEAFGSPITIDSGKSGDSRTCPVTESDLTSEGEYKFLVKVTPDGGSEIPSNTVTVSYDGNGPDKPKYIEKEKVNNCVNKITLKTADDDETTSVQVYADDDKEIDIDDSHKIETENIGSDEKFEFEHTVSGDDCDKTWYYAVVAFDDAGNASKPRSEVITTTTTTTEEGEEETGAIPVEGGAGIVEGGAATGVEGTEGTEGTQGTEVNIGEGEGEEGSVLGEQTGEEGKVLFKSPWFWIVAVGLGIVIISAVKKSKKN